MAKHDSEQERSLPLPPRILYPSLSPSTINKESGTSRHSRAENKLPLPPLPGGPWQTATHNKLATPDAAPHTSQPPTHKPTVIMDNILHRRGKGKTSFTITIPHLEFYSGELTCIRGLSGSGKSTLLKLLAMELSLQKGNITILDQNIRTLSRSEQDNLRIEGITYIAQGNFGLRNKWTATQNIQRLLQDHFYTNKDEALKLARESLRGVELKEHNFNKKIVPNLSGGERARVAVAKVYATERPICLMDEVLAPLDPGSQIAILHLFQNLASKGYTLIIIVHGKTLKDYFHRVITMKGGHIVGDQHQIPKLAIEGEDDV